MLHDEIIIVAITLKPELNYTLFVQSPGALSDDLSLAIDSYKVLDELMTKARYIRFAKIPESFRDIESLKKEMSVEEIKEVARDFSWYFWKFVHNMIIHPLLAFPYESKMVQGWHDWTSQRCSGGG